MGTRLTQPATAATKTSLAPVMTLEGHKGFTWSMAYFPDGKRIIGVFQDKTIRQWDLQTGKEIEEVRDVYEGNLYLAEVSRDGRWVVTSGGDEEYKELKVCEVEPGIVKTFQDSRVINCIDISKDGKLLASGSMDRTVLIWGMDTGEVVAGPFKSDDEPDVIRFSPDSKKLAAESGTKKCLEVWDVQTQKLDARVGKRGYGLVTHAPMFWTKKRTILAIFNFDFDNEDSALTTIYEFDASTLETVGDPFKGHTNTIHGLAFSSDGILLASSRIDNTMKLWSIEPRQLLASFHLQHETSPSDLIFSPDARQLAYWAYHKILIYTTPPEVLTSVRVVSDAQAIVSAPDNSTLNDLLNSDATRRRANVRRKPATSPMISLPPRPLQPMHKRGLQQPLFFRHLRNLLAFSSNLNAVPPVLNGQPGDPLDIPATSSGIHDHTPVVSPSQGHLHSGPSEHPRRTAALPTTLSSASSPATLRTHIQHLLHWFTAHASHPQPPIVEVPLAQGKLRNAAAGAPNSAEDLIPDEYFNTSSQNPDSQQPSNATRIDTGEHGHGGSCFCF